MSELKLTTFAGQPALALHAPDGARATVLLHGAHRVEKAAVEAHAGVYAERLATYPEWPELAELAECVACEVPATARPSTEPEGA